MPVIARLELDARSPERGGSDPRLEPVDLYTLPEVDLGRFAALVVSPLADQEFLYRYRQVVAEFLDAGRAVIFGGHLLRTWLPGAAPFVPLPRPSRRAYQVVEVAEHPIFAGVHPDDLTFRRGVAGFFARGHHPPPPGARVLTRLAGGEPATYLDEVSTPGAILVQASSDLLGYTASLDSTAARIPGQLLDWALAAAAVRR